MTKVIFRPSFQADLAALRSNHRKNYEKTSAVVMEVQTGGDVAVRFRPETRIPNCVKYELSEGYRVVFQKVDGEDSLMALCVGKHDQVDSFLDRHKGWVFDKKTGRMKELRLATCEETAVQAIASAETRPDLKPETPAAPPEKTFSQFTDEMLTNLGVPKEVVPRLRDVEDPNSPAFMQMFDDIIQASPKAADCLLAYATGNSETKESILGVARGQLDVCPFVKSEHDAMIRASSDEFLTFDDPAELRDVLERGTFEQWQLFLHPAQKELVTRRLHGPARIRGISGSGKTVVAMHRARHLAKQCSASGQKVLFTTFNKALAQSASHLLNTLCGAEKAAIEVTHLHRWCLDYISFRGLPRPASSSDGLKTARSRTLDALSADAASALQNIPPEYVWDEIEFIFGRFMHEEVDGYLETDRSGRGRALQTSQRKAILEVYKKYHQHLMTEAQTDPAEFVRIAYRLRRADQPSRHQYAAVIVDEVQDISELGLRLLHTLVGNAQDGLLLVGDATQRIHTRGYSMRGIGIDVTGRSVILTKNYRNTRQILQAAFPLVSKEWDADAVSAGVDPKMASPVFSVREGPRPAVVRCKDANVESRFIRREVKYLLDFLKYQPRDICVMARNRFYRDLAYNALSEAAIPVHHYQAERDAEAGVDRNAVRVSSLHSAKGHEYAVVLVSGLVEGVLPPKGTTEDAVTAEKAVLYVGMTRARDLLYLSYSEADGRGWRQERSRYLGEIAKECDLFFVGA